VRHLVAPLVRQGITLLPGERPPAFDCYCPLASLPLAFKTDLSTIPSNVPYLAAPPDRLAVWRQRLPAGRKIGLVWGGKPNFRNDGCRSMRLPQVTPLLTVPDVTFVSLNPGLPLPDCAELTRFPNVLHLAPELRDFADTAAAIAALDLVVTTDTATAHLAGALGKPV